MQKIYWKKCNDLVYLSSMFLALSPLSADYGWELKENLFLNFQVQIKRTV